MNRIAVKIKEARIKAGLSEKALAKKCGLQVAYILQVESGKKIINESVADQILKALGTEVTPLSETAIAYDQSNETVAKPIVKKPTTTSQASKPVEPNAQWGGILKQVIYDIPVYSDKTMQQIDTIQQPVVQNKVFGHSGEKLYYVRLTENAFAKGRLLKGDDVLILKTKQLTSGSLVHFSYRNSNYLGRLQTLDQNKVSIACDTLQTEALLKDVEILGQCLRVQFTL